MTNYTDLKARLGRIATLYGYCTDDTISANTAQAATEALAAIDALEAKVARLRNAIMDRLHWVVLDGSHCDCGECVALVAALNGEAQA